MKKVLIFLVGFFLLTTSAVSAATFKAGEYVEHKGDAITDDLYMAGGVVDISGNIVGDSVTAGGEVSIAGDVTGDVLSVGGVVELLSIVSDDARVAGGEVRVSGTIRDDLVVAGGYVRMLGDANVGGDVVVASGASVINGTVSGDVVVYGGEVILGGIVNGDVDLRFTEKVTLSDDVTIGGDLTYSAREEIEIPEGAFIGGEVTKVDSPLSFNKDETRKFFNSFALVQLMMALATAVVLVLLFRKLSLRFGEDGYKHLWKNTLVGFVAMVVTPILALVLAISMIGMFAGGILFLIGTTLLVIAKAYGGVLVGALLSKWTIKKVVVDWKWAILGVVALFIVKLIPFVGTLTWFVILLASFGTILMILYRGVWRNR